MIPRYDPGSTMQEETTMLHTMPPDTTGAAPSRRAPQGQHA
ncbi:hypothetical protein [Pseudoduganella dura]|nr:hypothetical protein [Pseudoduganella dura]